MGRRPGRTTLVALLVAAPVLAMTAADVIARTDGTSDSFAEYWGRGADIVVAQPLDEEPIVFDGRLPDDATIVTSVGAEWIPIEAADGTVTTGVALEHPGGAEPVRPLRLTAGRLPAAPDEVWLSAPLLRALGVGVGESLTLRHPAGTWRVVGTGRVADSFDSRRMVVADLAAESFHARVLTHHTVVDLAPGASPERVRAVVGDLALILGTDDPLAAASITWRGADDAAAVPGAALAWGWVAGVLALAAVGVVITAAFATSARRQLVTVGLLSSNGASENVIRRTLALQGLWTGLAGTAGGMAGGVVMVVAGRSTIESWMGSVLPGLQFRPLDLVVILVTGVAAATVAALVPARTASRVPVMAALAGRRPLAVVPRRLVPVGGGLFALGVLLLVVPASGDSAGQAAAAAAVVGGLLVLAGMCCASPLAIDAMARTASHVGRSWRFAGRSLGRTRARSAAVVTAIAVTGAIATAGSAVAASIGAGRDEARQWPRDAVVVSYWNEPTYTIAPDEGAAESADFGPADERPLDTHLTAAVEAIAPGGTWYPRRVVTWDAPPYSDDDGGLPDAPLDADASATIVVADEATMDLYELSALERRRLESTGALLLHSWGWWGGPLESPEIQIETTTGAVRLPIALRTVVEDEVRASGEGGPPAPAFTGVWGTDQIMMTETAARAAGLDIVVRGGFRRGDAPLTADQRQRLMDDPLLGGWAADLSTVYRDVTAPSAGDGPVSVGFDIPAPHAATVAMQAVIVGAALLLTLVVVAIGLALAAAEGRDERDVLVAVGAPPSTMRSMAGAKAVVMTVTGIALAIPTGLIPTYAVARAADDAFRVPWLGVGLLLLVVPGLAGAAAWAASAVAQSVRPVRMSTLTTD